MLYDPDPGAIPDSTRFTRQLSQRDLSLQIPVNYVTVPGVSVTPACFASKRYEDVSAGKCFSNLLAVGFNRFVVDIYWDVSRQLWSLCPVELGPQTTASSSSTSSTTSTSTADAAARRFDVFALLKGRQTTSAGGTLVVPSTLSDTGGASFTSVTATTTLSPGSPTTSPNAPPTLPSGELIDVGPYSCTESVNLPLFGRILNAHLESTQNRLNATLKYFVFNLHAAAPASNPTGPANAPSPSDLPKRGNLLSSIFSQHVYDYLYTPGDLQSERMDINASTSWYGGDQTSFQPDSSYFKITESNGESSSPNGWPSESFMEMEYGIRLLVGYGQVDPQMQAYNFSGDSSVIFPSSYIQKNTSATTNSGGQVNSGCFYQSNTYSLSNVNSSWATYANFDDLTGTSKVFGAASNLTYCGISPILNKTLDKVTADEDYEPYGDYVQSTIWSWADGEPRNGTEPDADSPTANRCAAMNATSGYWQTENCAMSHYNACRKPSEIYKWTISDAATTYLKAGITCDPGTQFTVPYTSLENTYLLHLWRSAITANNIDDELLWVNFNDLDAKSCWVIGQNETCPYKNSSGDDRDVVVPIVASIIVFVLAALTIFVKCAANRQQSKRRRRRGDDGWDYEGVPS